MQCDFSDVKYVLWLQKVGKHWLRASAVNFIQTKAAESDEPPSELTGLTDSVVWLKRSFSVSARSVSTATQEKHLSICHINQS